MRAALATSGLNSVVPPGAPVVFSTRQVLNAAPAWPGRVLVAERLERGARSLSPPLPNSGRFSPTVPSAPRQFAAPATLTVANALKPDVPAGAVVQSPPVHRPRPLTAPICARNRGANGSCAAPVTIASLPPSNPSQAMSPLVPQRGAVHSPPGSAHPFAGKERTEVAHKDITDFGTVIGQLQEQHGTAGERFTRSRMCLLEKTAVVQGDMLLHLVLCEWRTATKRRDSARQNEFDEAMLADLEQQIRCEESSLVEVKQQRDDLLNRFRRAEMCIRGAYAHMMLYGEEPPPKVHPSDAAAHLRSGLQNALRDLEPKNSQALLGSTRTLHPPDRIICPELPQRQRSRDGEPISPTRCAALLAPAQCHLAQGSHLPPSWHLLSQEASPRLQAAPSPSVPSFRTVLPQFSLRNAVVPAVVCAPLYRVGSHTSLPGQSSPSQGGVQRRPHLAAPRSGVRSVSPPRALSPVGVAVVSPIVSPLVSPRGSPHTQSRGFTFDGNWKPSTVGLQPTANLSVAAFPLATSVPVAACHPQASLPIAGLQPPDLLKIARSR